MSTEQKTILIKSGAGYIGFSTVKALKQSGYKLILDNLTDKHRDIGKLPIPLIVEQKAIAFYSTVFLLTLISFPSFVLDRQ